jgi:amino acid permease
MRSDRVSWVRGDPGREDHLGIMRTKSVEQSIRDTEEPEFQLRKALGPLDLTVFGIGVIIGTGLFVMGFLTIGTWLRFFVWMAIGLVWYFSYSRTHSREARRASTGEVTQEG